MARKNGAPQGSAAPDRGPGESFEATATVPSPNDRHEHGRRLALLLAAKGYCTSLVRLEHDETGARTVEDFLGLPWSSVSTDDPRTVEALWDRFPQATHPLVDCGKSRIVVADCDPWRHPGAIDDWRRIAGIKPTDRVAWVPTPRGGRHYLYAANAHRPVGCRNDCWPGIDVKGIGGAVFAYPGIWRKAGEL